MGETRVVSMRGLRAGWDEDPAYAYIGRPGKGVDGPFGNPHPMVPGQTTRDESIQAFRAYFAERLDSDPPFRAAVMGLRGKALVCFCHPLPCHGDVIKEYLDSTEKAVWE